MIGNDSGPTAVAGAIRNFRKRVKQAMLAQVNVEINPSDDLIVNDRQHGYGFSDNITVREGGDLLVADQEEACDNVPERREALCSLPSETDEDSRARWILTELKKTGRIRKRQIIERTGCSDSTARRTLVRLRENGKIVFEGSARNGYWRLV